MALKSRSNADASEQYKGYMLWGHAILQQKEIPHPERYAASGTITKDNKVIEASGVPANLTSEKRRSWRVFNGHVHAWTVSTESKPLLVSMIRLCHSALSSRQ